MTLKIKNKSTIICTEPKKTFSAVCSLRYSHCKQVQPIPVIPTMTQRQSEAMLNNTEAYKAPTYQPQQSYEVHEYKKYTKEESDFFDVFATPDKDKKTLSTNITGQKGSFKISPESNRNIPKNKTPLKISPENVKKVNLKLNSNNSQDSREISNIQLYLSIIKPGWRLDFFS